MNDDKYGRLYPERAVAPLRSATTVLLEMLTGERSEADRAQYVALAQLAITDLDDLGFPPDEPLFLLRGQDHLASCTVKHYAEDIRLSKMPEPMRSTMRAHVLEFAARMEAWKPQKLPD